MQRHAAARCMTIMALVFIVVSVGDSSFPRRHAARHKATLALFLLRQRAREENRLRQLSLHMGAQILTTTHEIGHQLHHFTVDSQ